MSATRRFQLFVSKETQPGVTISDASLFVVGNATVQPKDPKFTVNVDQYQREVVRASLSPMTSISGRVDCEISFAVEVAGPSGGTATTVPSWGPLLEACALRSQPIKVASINSTFGGTSGQKVIEHLSAAAGNTESVITIGDTWEGQTRLRYYLPSGSDDFESADTVTVTLPATTTVTCTTSSVGADGGNAWFPVSAGQIALDVSAIPGGAPASGDLFKGATSGAILVARATIAASAAQAFELIDGTVNVTAGETLTNLTQAGKDCTIAAAAAVSQTRNPTLTIGLIEDGAYKKATGCRGTVSFSGELGKPVFMNFTFKGTLATLGDKAPLTGVTYSTQVPPKFMGGIVKLGSQSNASYPGYNTYTTEHTPRITSFSLDYGAQVAIQQDATQTNGTTWAWHTGTRQGKLQFNPEIRPESSMPLLTLLQAGNMFRFRTSWGTNTNRFLLMAPSCKPTGEGTGDRDGFATRDYSADLSCLDVNGAEREDCELIFVYAYSGNF